MDINSYNKVFNSLTFGRMERVPPKGRRVGLKLDGGVLTLFDGCTWPEAFQKALEALEASTLSPKQEGLPEAHKVIAHEVGSDSVTSGLLRGLNAHSVGTREAAPGDLQKAADIRR